MNYKKLDYMPKIGDIISNFSGSDYYVLFDMTDSVEINRSFLLQNIQTGCLCLAYGVAKYHKCCNEADVGIIGFAWDSAVYFGNNIFEVCEYLISKGEYNLLQDKSSAIVKVMFVLDGAQNELFEVDIAFNTCVGIGPLGNILDELAAIADGIKNSYNSMAFVESILLKYREVHEFISYEVNKVECRDVVAMENVIRIYKK